MKKFLLLLMILPGVAVPQVRPNFIQQMEDCAEEAVSYTQMAVYANQTSEKDKIKYDAFIDKLSLSQTSPAAGNLLMALGNLAWASRGLPVHETSMDVYLECVSHLGIKT